MNIYRLEVWFRKNGEKDFDLIDVEAESELVAWAIARDLISWVFKIHTLEVTPC